jgi:AraC family transcriptional regulator
MPSATFLTTGALTARIASDPRGIIDAPANPFGPGIVVHLGQSVEIACRRGGFSHRGLSVHGDVDIVPAGTPSRWEIKHRDTALIIGLNNQLLRSVAEDRGLDFRRVEILNRFQIRDAQIEHIAWAIKSESGSRLSPSLLYTDSLATALAVRLLERHSSASAAAETRVSLSGRKLRRVLSYIEDHITRDLSLRELASLAGLGASQFKKVFRESVGLPVHRYVMERRVERAKSLLCGSHLPIAQVAAEAGFAHQSHLARLMRRITGVSPQQFRRESYRE